MTGFLRRLAVWLEHRLSERSTYAGLTLLFAAYGREIPQAVLDALGFWGPFVAGGLIAASEGDKNV